MASMESATAIPRTCRISIFKTTYENPAGCKSYGVKNLGEGAKVALRNIRRDAVDALRSFKKESVITEDDLYGLEKDVDKAVSDAIAEVDKHCRDKEAEIMSV